MTEAPRQIAPARDEDPSTLTGKLFAWKIDRPVTISIDGSEREYLPCFSDAALLRKFYEHIEFKSIKQIDDGPEFFESVVGEGLTVILNPHTTPQGSIRYTELRLVGPS